MTTNKHFFIEPSWPAPANIKAYTTLRDSRVGYPKLATKTAGDVDWTLLKTTLNLPNDPVWLHQTHSIISRNAATTKQGSEGDAVFTDETNQVCAVLTADCLPVLVCNKQGTKVAAIHAGWRGLANGVIEATLESLNLPTDETLIWLGPAIGPTKFEIRKDVFEIFTGKDPAAETAMQKISDEHWLADIYALARLRLQKRGITQIYGGEYCTHSDPERFFSYRRDGKIIGSIVSLIWIAI